VRLLRLVVAARPGSSLPVPEKFRTFSGRLRSSPCGRRSIPHRCHSRSCGEAPLTGTCSVVGSSADMHGGDRPVVVGLLSQNKHIAAEGSFFSRSHSRRVPSDRAPHLICPTPALASSPELPVVTLVLPGPSPSPPVARPPPVGHPPPRYAVFLCSDHTLQQGYQVWPSQPPPRGVYPLFVITDAGLRESPPGGEGQ